jgi:hypothetical protein
LQPDQVKQEVTIYKQNLATGTGSVSSRRSPQASRVQHTLPAGLYGAPIPGPSFHNSQPESISLNSPPNPIINLPQATDHSDRIDPSIRFHPYLRSGSNLNMGFASTSDNHSPPSSIYLHGAESSAESISPYDSISVAASRVNSQPPSCPASRVGQVVRRRGSYIPGVVPPDTLAPHWSAARKKAFEKRILRLTASAGFPLSWTENLEWRLFCDEFVAGAPTISRKVLTKRILKEVVEEFQMEVKMKVAKKEATMQSDGWTGVNNHHLVAFMITADKMVCGVLMIFFPDLVNLLNMVGPYSRSPQHNKGPQNCRKLFERD